MTFLRIAYYWLVGCALSWLFRHMMKIEMPDWFFFIGMPALGMITMLALDCIDKLNEIKKALEHGRKIAG